jgi:hypothetical protein
MQLLAVCKREARETATTRRRQTETIKQLRGELQALLEQRRHESAQESEHAAELRAALVADMEKLTKCAARTSVLPCSATCTVPLAPLPAALSHSMAVQPLHGQGRGLHARYVRAGSGMQAEFRTSCRQNSALLKGIPDVLAQQSRIADSLLWRGQEKELKLRAWFDSVLAEMEESALRRIQFATDTAAHAQAAAEAELRQVQQQLKRSQAQQEAEVRTWHLHSGGPLDVYAC